MQLYASLLGNVPVPLQFGGCDVRRQEAARSIDPFNNIRRCYSPGAASGGYQQPARFRPLLGRLRRVAAHRVGESGDPGPVGFQVGGAQMA